MNRFSHMLSSKSSNDIRWKFIQSGFKGLHVDILELDLHWLPEVSGGHNFASVSEFHVYHPVHLTPSQESSLQSRSFFSMAIVS